MSVPRRPGPLVAREHVLQLLWGQVAASASEGMRAALVRGPAGSGKTRLLDAFVERARSAGATVVAGRAPLLGGHPYGALADALAGYVRSSPPAGGQVRRAGRALADLVPALVALEGPVASAPPDTLAVIQAAYRFLRQITERRPLVLVLDDAQLADADSCEVLAALARHAADLPWTLVLGWRDPTDEVRREARGLLDQLRRERAMTEIDLEPLDVAATAELVAALLGDGLPSPGLVEMLQTRTAGNPQYLEEMVHWLRQTGRLRRVGLQWIAAPGSEEEVPPTLEEALRERVRSLDPAARAVLQWLAAAGGSADLDLLAEVSGLDPAALALALDDLLAAGLVVEQRGGPRTTHRIRHPLVVGAVERELGAAHRRDLHRSLGRALAARGEPAEVVAAHHVRAAEPGDEEALAAAMAAGEAAESRTNLLQALTWYEAVLRLAPRPDHARRLLALDRISDLGSHAGRPELARSAIEELLARTPPEDRLRRATLLRRLASVHIAEGDPTAARQAIEEGLTLCAGVGAEAAHLFAELAMVAEMTMSVGDLAAVVERGRKAAAASAATGASVLLRAFEALAVTDAGDPRRGLEIALTGGREAIAAEDLLAFGYNAFVAGVANVLLGRFEQAERSLENFVVLAEDAGLVWGSAWMWVLIGQARLFQGKFEEALPAFLRAEELGRRPGAAIVMPLPEILTAEGLLAADRTAEAADRLDEARRWLEDRPSELGRAWYLHSLGLLRLAEGRPEEAIAPLEEMTAILAARGQFLGLALVPTLVHALVAAGRPGEGLAVARDIAGRLAGRDIPLCAVTAARALATALVAAGEVATGVAEARRAVHLADAVDGRFFEALARSTLGEALLAAGELREGRERLLEAHDAFALLGAEAERRRVLDRLAALGVAPPAPARPRAARDVSAGQGDRDRGGLRDPLASLTPRERQVVELAVTGMSSRAIALRLGLSERTVENHLQRVYEKLGLHRRAELIAVVAGTKG